MTSLKNKVALVTGSARGIGKAIAARYGSLGASVVVNYSTDGKRAQEAVEEICKMIFLLLVFLLLVIPIGVGVTNIVSISGTNLNATIRCFVPNVNIDPRFVSNGTNSNIDPPFVRNGSNLVNP